ncbi:MAG: oligosaccharide flippase family protein [Bacteroidota bacterium]
MNKINADIAFAYLFQTANAGLTFISSILVARLLGLVYNGEYAIYTSALLILNVWFGFGLPGSIVHLVAAGKVNADKLRNSAYLFSMTAGIVVLGLLYLLDIFHASGLVFPVGKDSGFWKFIFIIQFSIGILNGVLVAFANARQLFFKSGLITLLSSGTLLILLILYKLEIVYINSLDAFSFVVGASVAAGLVQIIGAWALLRSEAIPKPNAGMLDLKSFGIVLQMALLVWLCNGIQMLNYRTDYWILDHFQGARATSLYAVGSSLAQLIRMFPTVVATVLVSHLSQSKQTDSVPATIRYLRAALGISALTGILAMVVLYPLIPLIYGSDFTEVRAILAPLFIGVTIFTIPIIFAAYFVSIGAVRINLFASILVFLVGLCLDFMLIPTYSLKGAVFASVGAYFAGAIYHLYVFCKRNRLQLFDLFFLPQNRFL